MKLVIYSDFALSTKVLNEAVRILNDAAVPQLLHCYKIEAEQGSEKQSSMKSV